VSGLLDFIACVVEKAGDGAFVIILKGVIYPGGGGGVYGVVRTAGAGVIEANAHDLFRGGGFVCF
jgi:hypothetical protein